MTNHHGPPAFPTPVPARPSRPRWRLLGAASGACALAALLAACGQKPGTAGGAMPPAPGVTVSKPTVRQVVDQEEYTGHLAAPDMVNLEARVSGLVTAAPFEEGAMVKAGDVLFVIDESPFKATLDSREADVVSAKAHEELTEANFKRLDKIHGTRAISEEDFDTAKAMRDQAIAAVAAAQAACETARLNLRWTHVLAPITGRISRKLVTVGNLVTGGGGGGNGSGSGGGGGTGTLLTTIVSVDPLYCYVDVPEGSYLKYQAMARHRAAAAGKATAPIPCALELDNETGFPHPGVVDFVDNRVDPNTGTVQVRGVFKDPGHNMTPGLFAQMRIPGSEPYQAIMVPDAAIGTSQSERFLLIVDNEDKVVSRRVTLGGLFGQLRVITSGLKPDDRVIIDGFGLPMVHPGAQVTPEEAAAPATQPAGAAPAASAAPAPSPDPAGPRAAAGGSTVEGRL